MLVKEITISTTSNASELVADILYEISSQGVGIYDYQDFLDLEKTDKFWDNVNKYFYKKTSDVQVKAYIGEDKLKTALLDLNNRLNFLKENSPFDLGSLEVIIRDVNSDEWFDNWKKTYKPIHINNITIVPTWLNYEASKNEIIVNIDPAMAFGSGEHESTRMCISFLQDIKFSNKKVVDIGTGSGILAIVAAKLGCKDVEAYDIDDVAVKAAKENISVNNVSDFVKVGNSDLLTNIKNEFDVVIANITSDVLICLSNDLKTYLKEDGIVIISGILNQLENDVKKAFLDKNYKIVERKSMGEWVAFKLKV